MSSKVEKESTNGWKSYAICFGITSFFVFLFLWGRGIFSLDSALDKVRIASDACFIVGVMTFGIGGLIFVAESGVFDGIVYAVKQFVWLFRIQGIGKKHESYYEYKLRLSEKPRVPIMFMIVIGLFWILMAGLFVVWFNKIEAKPMEYLFNNLIDYII